MYLRLKKIITIIHTYIYIYIQIISKIKVIHFLNAKIKKKKLLNFKKRSMSSEQKTSREHENQQKLLNLSLYPLSFTTLLALSLHPPSTTCPPIPPLPMTRPSGTSSRTSSILAPGARSSNLTPLPLPRPHTIQSLPRSSIRS